MADTGFINPGTIIGTGTGLTWANPTNAATSNNSYATAVASANNQSTQYLEATNFGFFGILPAYSGLIITRMDVEIEQKTGGGTVHDADVKYRYSGGTSVINKATATSYSTTDTYQTYTWTGADLPSQTIIENSTFGIDFSALVVVNSRSTVSIDHIAIKIYYELPSQAIMISDD